MHINEKPFIGLDLNLLLTFLVIFREGSLTETARHLRVTQPAISGALVRLRNQFDDELFIRTRRKMKPTARAEAIAQVLLPAMAQIETLLRPVDSSQDSGITS
ncbi:LysR family transcriptional regulator [Pseudomonas sp. NPDC090202]|uniref:LysR family transcriptional regulator n=1 Tax=Pseudomonas sp. NPDC090202 TaxID=3364476 RepID=UPI003824339E